ncbi:MAG: peptidase T [Bacteroidota bacterium]
MKLDNLKHTVAERFLNYVKVDTQSDPNSTTFPSTEKQKNLAKILVSELTDMGIDCELDVYGYVYATIPSNSNKDVPVICFCSHMDTSPDCSGENVKPIVHTNYNGQDIILPEDNTQIISPKNHPDLLNQIGNDIITADGTTLLGADNKAGVAEIMDAAYQLVNNPEIKHGTIKILFTPDEEVGRGVEHVDLKKLGATFAYTMDGESLGTLENETFSANALHLKINGVSTHPGFAKNKMESAIKIASQIISSLPKDFLSPESTENKEGFVHPVSITGGIEEAKISFIIRDFDSSKLAQHENVIKTIAENVMLQFPHSTFSVEVIEQYRNMKEILDNYPQVVEYAKQAIERVGLDAKLSSIRGGTDGSRLSFMGLPCPNIFAGEHAFHSKHEWVSIQDMEKSVQTILHLAIIWEEKS